MSPTLNLLTNIFNTLNRNFIFILIPSLIAGAMYGMYTRKTPGVFTSYSKIFPLTQEAGIDPAAGIKASLGIGGGGSALSKYYNVNELVKSRNLSRKIVQYPSKNTKYKNLYLWIIEDHNSSLPMFKKKIKISKDSLENINTAADIFTSKTSVKVEKSDFTTINVSCGNADLSLRLNECILECISDFYIKSKTAKASADVAKIANLRDSLRGVMDLLMYKQADFIDKNLFATKLIASLPQAKLERMREEVEEAYGVSLSAYTNANFKLLSESPIFQILDKPVGPVAFEKKGWKVPFIMAFAITFILLSILAIRKHLVGMAMAELNKM